MYRCIFKQPLHYPKHYRNKISHPQLLKLFLSIYLI